MLKKLFSTLICISGLAAGSLMAQSGGVMFMNEILEPMPGHAAQLEKGVKAHNAKYHTTGEAKASLFSIMTGPRSGQYAWVQGPMTYATLDKPLSAEHNADWDANVAAHCRNMGDLRLVKRDEATTYNPSNEVMAENYLARVFYGVTDVNKLLEAVGMIQKVYVANKTTSARRVYVSEFRNKDEEAVTLVYPFKSFTEFEKTKGLPFADLPAEMVKVHGPNGFQKFRELMDASNSGWYDEIRVMVK